MKNVDLSSAALSAADLLDLARNDSLLVKTVNGDSFLVSPADELTAEVELLRRNHDFLTLLDEFKREKETLSLDQVERELL